MTNRLEENPRLYMVREFRVIYGPQFGTVADETGEGVTDPAQLRPDRHYTKYYHAPDVFGVVVGCGHLFAEGRISENYAVRIEMRNTDGQWVEYGPEMLWSQSELGTAPSSVQSHPKNIRQMSSKIQAHTGKKVGRPARSHRPSNI